MDRLDGTGLDAGHGRTAPPPLGSVRTDPRIQAGRIQALKRADGRFAELVERYQVVNRALHRMEERIEPVAEETERASRRERLYLKDENARALAAEMA